MNEVTPALSINYIAQFSFSVLFEILTFSNIWSSIQFIGLILFLVFLGYLLPDWHLNSSRLKELTGIESFPVVPFWLRLLLAASISFVWIFLTAHQAGKTHACRYLQGKINLNVTVDAPFSGEEYNAFYGAFGYQVPTGNDQIQTVPNITEVWRNSDFIYFVKREASCDTPRIVVKVPADRFQMLRYRLENQS